MLVVVLVLAGLARAAAEDPPGHRLALYVGIDRYPRIENGNLDGCVNDVLSMRDLFAERFGFNDTILRINETATRQGIGEALQELLQRDLSGWLRV